ncbi:MAG: biotin--[acetyl-CoA-carboxylase] ligase [Oligoflexia bacterium]|nr:biotin--[acetyl-CoA-carboxylase] ligase [Oligoflexia bacterium]
MPSIHAQAANTVVEVSESTNDDARRLAEAGFPHGTWVSARRQISGRGRLGRKWESLEGNLFLSILARLPAEAGLGKVWSWIPLATAVAIAETLRSFDPRLDLEIKWPNDLWLKRAKAGGILCEAANLGAVAQSPYVVIGIGLNCAAAPEGVDQEATFLRAVAPQLSVDELRMPIVSGVLDALDELQIKGASSIARRYEKLAAFKSGDAVSWRAGSAGSESTPGFVEKLGPDGELLVKDLAGATRALYAEDVKIRAARSKASESLP